MSDDQLRKRYFDVAIADIENQLIEHSCKMLSYEADARREAEENRIKLEIIKAERVMRLRVMQEEHYHKLRILSFKADAQRKEEEHQLKLDIIKAERDLRLRMMQEQDEHDLNL